MVSNQSIDTPTDLISSAVPIYERYSELLGSTLKPEDSETLAHLAVLESIVAQSAREIEDNGATAADKAHSGEHRRSASFAILKQSIELATKLKVQLGMTPKMRKQLHGESNAPDIGSFLYGDSGE